MAIYGVGSNWNGEELKDRFFEEGKFILGWNEESAKDLYAFVASLKVGDILYIKANQPGSRTIRVKGVGIVTKNLLTCMSSAEFAHSIISDWESLFVEVSWIHREEFLINIPENEGKLTNIRAATIYEEYLPYVQDSILAKIIYAAGGKMTHELEDLTSFQKQRGNTMHLIFEGDEEKIKAVSLTNYLLLFRAIYLAIETREEIGQPLNENPDEYRKIWDDLPPEHVIESLYGTPFPYFRRPWPFFFEDENVERKIIETDSLQIIAINKNSPLEITFCGISIALAVAVVISGGSIAFSSKGEVKCKLPPLGKGIEALRRAFKKKLDKLKR